MSSAPGNHRGRGRAGGFSGSYRGRGHNGGGGGGDFSLGDGLEAWRGFYQSLRPTQLGLTLNIGDFSGNYASNQGRSRRGGGSGGGRSNYSSYAGRNGGDGGGRGRGGSYSSRFDLHQAISSSSFDQLSGSKLPMCTDIKFEIPLLNHENYKEWKERILLYLGVMDMNFAIRNDEPLPITETTLPDAVDLYEKWESSNNFCVMFIKLNMSDSIQGMFEIYKKVRPLLKAIEDQFQASED